MKQQRGSLYRRHGFWILRFRETINVGGKIETKQRAKKLCPVDELHKTERSVWRDENVAAEIKRILERVSAGKKAPETLVTLGGFVKDVYLPFVDTYKRASTYKGYLDMWEDHVERVAGNVLLRNVRTVDVQNMIERIAREDKTKKGTPLSHETLKHIKSFISGIFSHAKRQGYFDAANPVQCTAIPPAPKGGETYAYNSDEINRMILISPEPGATMLAVAAYTAMRRSEIGGLNWEDYRGDAIYVSRSISLGKINEPKTSHSRAPVPVVPFLAAMLKAHRQRLGNPNVGPIFPNSKGGNASLNNILNRIIKPSLNRCEVCGTTKALHVKATGKFDHAFKRDERFPQWRGWHAFRRGVATNLHDLGVDDKTIQAILRHSDVSVTQRCYIKTLPPQTVAAMNALESSMCADRALGTAVFQPNRVN